MSQDMKTLTIVLIVAGVLLLILLATAPCERDHYANQVVHAGAGNIAGPIIQLDERPYVPPPPRGQPAGVLIDEFMPVHMDMMDEDDMNSVIVGRMG